MTSAPKTFVRLQAPKPVGGYILLTVRQLCLFLWLYRPRHLEALLTDCLHHLGIGGPQERGLLHLVKHYHNTGRADSVADALIDDWEKPRDHFTKVTSNLIPAFRGVVGLPLGPLFSPIPADITWRRIVEERMVVYVALASLLLGDIANRIGRVILQDLVSYLGRIYAYGDATTTPPITVLIDEFGDVAFPLFTNALNKGGDANARFILVQQSLADAEADGAAVRGSARPDERRGVEAAGVAAHAGASRDAGDARIDGVVDGA